MATTFTTWTALYQARLARLADYASGKSFVTTKHVIDTGGTSRTFEFLSLAEYREMLLFVKSMADTESGSGAVGRTLAKQGGSGRCFPSPRSARPTSLPIEALVSDKLSQVDSGRNLARLCECLSSPAKQEWPT